MEKRDKIGLIGANGAGKTTIFKVITGLLSPTLGSVTKSAFLRIGYMEQHSSAGERTLYEELLSVFDGFAETEKKLEQIAKEIESGSVSHELLDTQQKLRESYERDGGLTYKSRTRSALLGLGFKEKDFGVKTSMLSGGQRSKLSLAKLLLSKADILLLDEPTNHLDIASISWLEDFLCNYGGAALIISHDRYFLDKTTNKTVELRFGKTISYIGNYSEFLIKREQRTEALKKQYEKDSREIKRIEGIVEQQKRWGQAHNFITAASKQKQADKLKEQLVLPESELKTIRFNFTPKRVSGNDVLICESLKKSFGEKQLFKDVSMHIRKGERVFILGGNGCGKTTLFKILLNKLPYDSGNIKLGANVDMGYFDQVQADLDLGKTALDEVWDAYPDLTETRVRTALGSFLLSGDEVKKPLSVLSGGERARVSLLKLMLKGPNFLLLDEPTNHLDASSREQLEKTLSSYDGTMLIVSHDRYFINKLATRVLVLSTDGVKEFIGNYESFVEKQKPAQKSSAPVKKQNEYTLRKEEESRRRKLGTRIKRVTQEIESRDSEIAQLEAELLKEEVTSDYEKLLECTSRLEALNKEQEEGYALWETLTNELDD